MNETDKYNGLRNLEIKVHLHTMDKKLELLWLKHKNLELAFDSLSNNMNERLNMLHENKHSLGKRNVSRDRKEMVSSWLESTLEYFFQASFDLQVALGGANEALAFDWKK